MKAVIFSLLFSLISCSPLEILNVEDAEAGYGHVMSGVAGQEVQGSFYWKAPEGDDISLTYTAGDAGYLAEGDHLPLSPEVPAAPLPVMVDYTPEVAAARSSFLEKFNLAKMRAEEEEGVMVERRRRDAEDEEAAVEAGAEMAEVEESNMNVMPYSYYGMPVYHPAVYVPTVSRTVQVPHTVYPVNYPMFRYPGMVWSYPGSPLNPTVSIVQPQTVEREGLLPKQKLEGEDEPAALEF